MFLRSNGGFQIQVESDWGIDPLEAYKQATESLSNKLRIHGVSYKNLSTIMELNEDLAVEDRAYGKVYRMRLAGFVSDDDIAKARQELSLHVIQTQFQFFLSLSAVLVSAEIFTFVFAKADQLSRGDKRVTVSALCIAMFLIVSVFAIGTIW